MSQSNKRNTKSNFSLLTAVLLVAFLFVLFTHRQRIFDQIAFWQYQPSSAISELFKRSDMNENGKFYFYSSHPILDSTQTFNDLCNRVEMTTAIIGCYNGKNIFLFNVKNSQLDGIREVTAVHETLHAAYSRLSMAEKKKVDKLIDEEYKKLENDEHFVETMAFYARTEPGQRNDELHSIIGTEVSSINPELENYYSRYFINRQTIVKFYENYNNVFKSLKKHTDDLALRLNNISVEITTQTTDYNNNARALNSEIAIFNKKASNGDFVDTAQFYNERNRLSGKVDTLDALRSKINSAILEYGVILDEYNSITLESKKLYSAIDSTLAPAPSV